MAALPESVDRQRAVRRRRCRPSGLDGTGAKHLHVTQALVLHTYPVETRVVGFR